MKEEILKKINKQKHVSMMCMDGQDVGHYFKTTKQDVITG
jgi:hypothetical protein